MVVRATGRLARGITKPGAQAGYGHFKKSQVPDRTQTGVLPSCHPFPLVNAGMAESLTEGDLGTNRSLLKGTSGCHLAYHPSPRNGKSLTRVPTIVGLFHCALPLDLSSYMVHVMSGIQDSNSETPGFLFELCYCSGSLPLLLGRHEGRKTQQGPT